jgi:hypothetical protein
VQPAESAPILPSPGSNTTAKVPIETSSASAGSVPTLNASHARPVSHSSPSSNLNVRLNVNHSAIDHYIQRMSGNPGAGGWWTSGGTAPADTVALRDQLKQKLQERVGLMLNQAAGAETPVSPVSICFCSPPISSENSLVPAGSRSIEMGQGTVLAIGSGLALCVLVVLSMNRKRPKNSVPSMAIAESNPDDENDLPEVWMDNSVDGEHRDRIRQQIDELIDKNPEAAARVIQSWIRDAA